MDVYLDEEILPKGLDFGILLWWKLNSIKYPTLQTIAMDVLTILVSIVASEFVFSTRGYFVIKPSSKLTSLDHFEPLMCARSWLWSIENIGKTFLVFYFLFLLAKGWYLLTYIFIVLFILRLSLTILYYIEF